MHIISRRKFLSQTTLASACAMLPSVNGLSAKAGRHWRAAIIGHTGYGNYGHDLDAAFDAIPNVEVVAIADPDAAGRARAAERSQAQRQYSDYREMLAREKPDLAVVAPRWSEGHYERQHLCRRESDTQTMANNSS